MRRARLQTDALPGRGARLPVRGGLLTLFTLCCYTLRRLRANPSGTEEHGNLVDAAVRLWTWHKPDFSLTSDRVDWSRSDYYNDESLPEVRKAYARLAEQLGTDQIIWCVTRREDHIVLPSDECCEWEIEVPSDNILRFVNAIVWNRIIGRNNVYPNYGREWRHRAAIQAPGDEARQCEIVKQCEMAFDASLPPSLWSALFVNCPGVDVNALLTCPIEPKWVVARGVHTPIDSPRRVRP